jgi:hypothetical protein
MIRYTFRWLHGADYYGIVLARGNRRTFFWKEKAPTMGNSAAYQAKMDYVILRTAFWRRRRRRLRVTSDNETGRLTAVRVEILVHSPFARLESEYWSSLSS